MQPERLTDRSDITVRAKITTSVTNGSQDGRLAQTKNGEFLPGKACPPTGVRFKRLLLQLYARAGTPLYAHDARS